MDICIMKTNDHSYRVLYECINKPEDAMLLAQFAMENKNADELVFIFPGFNTGIHKNKELLHKAIELAEEFKTEKLKIYHGDDMSFKKAKLHQYIDNLF